MPRNHLAVSLRRAVATVLLVFLSSGVANAATFISDSVLDSHGHNGRVLLQAKKGCPVNFEGQNYTIVTSQCKGPQYPAKVCCDALKQLACPFADELNDATNDCASTMFSYINLYGKYPPGLFASECREGKEGLACPENATDPAAGSKLQTSGVGDDWRGRPRMYVVAAAALTGIVGALVVF